jgi:RNA polymerase sigma-70 factor (ECF subfamily)
MEDTPDETLVNMAQDAVSGDHRAFEELLLRHRGKVLANCRFITRSGNDAEDLAQEVFVKAFFGLKKLKSGSKFAAWIQRIKVNHCLNFIRKRKNKEQVDLDSQEAQMADGLQVKPHQGAEVEQRFKENRIRNILDTMSDNLRIPLILCDMDGLSYQEAADELGIGLSALKMRLKRAREYFKQRFEKAGTHLPASSETEQK